MVVLNAQRGGVGPFSRVGVARRWCGGGLGRRAVAEVPEVACQRVARVRVAAPGAVEVDPRGKGPEVGFAATPR